MTAYFIIALLMVVLGSGVTTYKALTYKENIVENFYGPGGPRIVGPSKADIVVQGFCMTVILALAWFVAIPVIIGAGIAWCIVKRTKK